MKLFKSTIFISAIATIISVICAFLASLGDYAYHEFVSNAFLGIFGSSVLTLVTGIIGYRAERKRVLENFLLQANAIITIVSQYNADHLSEREKAEALQNLDQINLTAFEAAIGDIDFVCDCCGNLTYICNKIYHPLHELIYTVQKHHWNIQRYLSSNPDIKGFEKCISEIEKSLGYSKESGTSRVSGIGAKKSSSFTMDIINELNGRFHVILYGKRKSKMMQKSAEERMK